MRKRFFGGAIIISVAMIALLTGVFSLRSGTPYGATPIVRAADFEYLVEGNGERSFGTFNNNNTVFTLRAFSGNPNGWTAGSPEVLASGSQPYRPEIPATPTKAVFGDDEIRAIQSGSLGDRYGFVKIDRTADETVFFKLTNISSLLSFQFKYYGYDTNPPYEPIIDKNDPRTNLPYIPAGAVGLNDIIDFAHSTDPIENYVDDYPQVAGGGRDMIWNAAGANVFLAGVFTREGYYEFQMNARVPTAYGTTMQTTLKFNFYVVHEANYPDPVVQYTTVDSANPNLLYCNYSHGVPAVNYNPARYDIVVSATDVFGMPNDTIYGYEHGTNNASVVEFKGIGIYTITSYISYFCPLKGVLVHGNYRERVQELNIFGVDAFYENYDESVIPYKKQLTFGTKKDADGVEIDSNITRTLLAKENQPMYLNGVTGYYMADYIKPYSPSNAVGLTIPTTSAGGNLLFTGNKYSAVTSSTGGTWSDATGIEWVKARISNLDVKPIAAPAFKIAVTNAPPVVLNGNVAYAGRVFYSNSGGVSWQMYPTFNSNEIYEQSGRYFIVVGFKYGGLTYFQTFYFEIATLVNPRIEATHKTSSTTVTYFFTDAARVVELTDFYDEFIVFYSNRQTGAKIGPYEFTPTIRYAHYPFNYLETTVGVDENGDEIYIDGNGNIVDAPQRIDKIQIMPDANGRLAMITDLKEGVYVFSVYYGARNAARMDFNVVVDTEKIKDFKFEFSATRDGDATNGKSLGTLPDKTIAANTNFGIFGPGEVGASWARKDSDQAGIKERFPNQAGVIGQYTSVTVDYYPFVYNENYFTDDYSAAGDNPNNYKGYTTNTSARYINSPYMLADMSVPITLFVAIQPDDRWTIIDYDNRPKKFTDGGLYFVTVLDTSEFSGKSSFAFIIDTTPAGFAQNVIPRFAVADEANIVDSESLTVGFGDYKVIQAGKYSMTNPNVSWRGQTIHLYLLMSRYGFGTAALSMSSYGVFRGWESTNDDNYFIFGLNNKQTATQDDVENYFNPESIDTNTLKFNGNTGGVLATNATARNNRTRNHLTVREEKFYFFRSNDVMGNQSVWYAWLNRDKSQGMVFETNTRDDEQNPTNPSIVLPDGMSNLSYDYFSFKPFMYTANDVAVDWGWDAAGQALGGTTGNRGPKYIVERIDRLYYPFALDTNPNTNPNYPFSQTGIQQTGIYNAPRVPVLGGDTKVDVTGLVAANPKPEKPIALPMNQNPTSEAGLYIMTRTYDYTYHYKYCCTDVDGWHRSPNGCLPNCPLGHSTGAAPTLMNTLEEYDHLHTSQNYFFIVDRNETVPPESNEWKSVVQMQIGDKVADNEDFSYTVKTNRPALLYLPRNESKYNANPTLSSITYYEIVKTNRVDGQGNPIYEPQIHTSRYFQALKLKASYTKDGGGATSMTFAQTNETGARTNYYAATSKFGQSGSYIITVKDGSGGVSWNPYNMVTSLNTPNRTLLRLIVSGGDTNTLWRVRRAGEEDIIPLPKSQTSIRFNEGDEIYFEYVNDDQDFYAQITQVVLVFSGEWLEPKYHYDEPAGRNVYTCGDFNPMFQEMFDSGRSIDMIALNVMVTSSSTWVNELVPPQMAQMIRTLFIDNTAPVYNLGELRKLDNLYSTAPALTKESYIYSVPNDFAFRMDPVSDIRDTYRIMYQEVDESLSPIGQSNTPFPVDAATGNGYGQAKRGTQLSYARPFADIVKRVSAVRQTRFFKITEYDEAGNMTRYYIRIRGEDYSRAITASTQSWDVSNDGMYYSDNLRAKDIAFGGATSNLFKNGGAVTHVFGSYISIINSYDYWVNNPNFTLSYKIKTDPSTTNETEFRRWYLQYDEIEDTMKKPSRTAFDNWLKIMLQRGVGTTVELTIKDGFTTRVVKIHQRTYDTPDPIIVATPSAGDLEISLSNRQALSNTYDGMWYKLQVYEIVGNTTSSIPIVSKNFNSDEAGVVEGIGGKSVLISVTSCFDRTGKTEYHTGDGLKLTVAVNEPTGFLPPREYIGHKDGVHLIWNNNTYELEINGTPVTSDAIAISLGGSGITQSANGIWSLSIRPRENEPDERAMKVAFRFRIARTFAPFVVSTVRKSGGDTLYNARDQRIMYEYMWNFYNRLPEFVFKNVNGDGIDDKIAAEESIDGMVEVALDRSSVMFDVTIDYNIYGINPDGTKNASVVIGNKIISRFINRFVLTQAGFYEIKITSSVGATRDYRVRIKEVDNTSFKIKYKYLETNASGATTRVERTVEASPILYKYTVPNSASVTTATEERNIQVFWLPTNVANDIKFASGALPSIKQENESISGNLKIVTSLNHKRRLAQPAGGSGATTTQDREGKPTAQWEFYYLESTTTGSRIYFAIACTIQTPDTAIRFTENGLPYESSSVYRLYRSMGVNGVGVSLSRAVQDSARYFDPLDPNNPTKRNPTITNVFFVDFYHNSVYGGRYFHKDTKLFYRDDILIENQDYGVIDLRVSDWAGNVTRFSQGTGVSQITQDKFTILNLSTAPVLIQDLANGDSPQSIIDEMVYNGPVQISVLTDLPILGIARAASDYYATEIEILRDGERVEYFNYTDFFNEQTANFQNRETNILLKPNKELTQFSLFDTGRYTIKCKYNAGIENSNTVIKTSVHNIQVVDKNKFVQSFAFSGANNIRVSKIIYANKTDVSGQFGIIKTLDGRVSQTAKNFVVSTNNPSGRYKVTFDIDATNLRTSERYEREIWVYPLEAIDGVVRANAEFGLAHTKAVEIAFNPAQIRMVCGNGNASVVIYRNDVEYARFVAVTNTSIFDSRAKEDELKYVTIAQDEMFKSRLSSKGNYLITVVAENGTVVSSDGFAITSGDNSTMTFVLIGAVVAFIVGIFIFIRLRNGMRIK